MAFDGTTQNLDWDHFTDVYGERPRSNEYKKKWDNKALSYGGGSAPGSKKEVIELRLNVRTSLDKHGLFIRNVERFFESYIRLHQYLTTLGLVELKYPEWMIYLNTSDCPEAVFTDDHTIFRFTVSEAQIETVGKNQLQQPINDGILILPRGEQNK